MLEQQLMTLAREEDAANAAILDVAAFPFRAEFRFACEQNTCGCYNKNWMCPPHVGDIDCLIKRAQRFEKGLVYQTIGQLEDSFDYEGMVHAKQAHCRVSARIQARLPGEAGMLHLSAGACELCPRCAVLDAAPCRYPTRALASLEAYGIAVSELAASCGLKYINGKNTVTYFGVVLFMPREARACPA